VVNEHEILVFKWERYISKAAHYLGATWKSGYLTPLDGPKMYNTDLTMYCVVYMCMIHETNYASTSTEWTFLCVDSITNSLNIMEELAVHQLVGTLPYKYILFPMQVVMVMC